MNELEAAERRKFFSFPGRARRGEAWQGRGRAGVPSSGIGEREKEKEGGERWEVVGV